MAQQIYKTPLEQSKSMRYKMPAPLQKRWVDYLNHGFSGKDIDKWNNEIMEIEKLLPFENDEEHEKWLDLGSTWNGEAEWPEMTQKLIDKYKKSETGINDYNFRRFIENPEEFESSQPQIVIDDAIKHGLKQYPNHPYFKKNAYTVKEWK